MVEFSIVTPSCNMLDYLQCCVASVRDQQVNCEHIIVDNVSTDGTVEWLIKHPDLHAVIEEDKGMYNAINKGIKLAKGRFVGYLNCDEQYLEGTLRTVREYFHKYSSTTDILYGNKIHVNEDGSFNSFKKSIRYNKYYILTSSLYIPSCALFFRREIFDQGFFFDDSYRSCGDAEFLIRLGDNNFRFKRVDRYLSAFTIQKNNLSQHPASIMERRRFEEAYDINRIGKKLMNASRVVEKIFSGRYYQKFPFDYAIYTKAALGNRTNFVVKKGSFITDWK